MYFTCILAAYTHCRDGNKPDYQLLKSILSMMFELSYYTKYFEPQFLKVTFDYYKAESYRLVHSLSIPEYILHANKRREEELEERISAYLDIQSKQKLDKGITHELIYSKANIIIQNGFNEMMENQLTEPLSIIYDLLKENDSQIDMLRQAYGEYTKVTIETSGHHLKYNPIYICNK